MAETVVAAAERTLPHNLDAERSVLGAILVHNDALNSAVQIVESRDELDFLRSTWLFADGVSCMTLNRLVRESEPVSFQRNGVIRPPDSELLVMRSGEALLNTATGYEERLHSGAHFGAAALTDGADADTQITIVDPVDAYRVPLGCIINLPVVRWKMLETHRRRYQG